MGQGGAVGAGRSTAIVLFTDLVGSTELRSRLGEDTAEELRHHHDELVAGAVDASRGHLVKNLGDGIMATFGGASDAVAAAVAIQQAIGRHNRSSAAALAVRIGISAGDVVFEGDDCFGTPVIEAARLCAAAVGGQILASETLRWLARSGDATFTPIGSLDLKGLPEPVPVVEVGWEPLPQSSIPLPSFLTDIGRIFVGRDRELARLGQLWKEAAAGGLRVALLGGEPGVGKTRLAAELAQTVHDEGATVLAGRCDEDLGVPYQPFVEGLRHFVDHAPAPSERLGRYGGELARLVPELSERIAGLPTPLRSDPETERYRLFDAVAAWLAAASADEPLLLVLDDLQWAAKPTLMLLRHVVRAAAGGRVLVLGTYRDTELTHDHPLLEVVPDLRRHGGVERLSLTGLDDVGVAALVEQAGGRALDEDGLALARAVHEETEGNPFFVREVLRHLAETGAVERQEGGWATQLPVDELGIPEGVRDVVGRRLSRLSSDANQALRIAAVVGAEFELGVVQAVGGLSEETLLAAVEEAAEARVVAEVSATRFRFAHALVRATIYESLTTARRVALHRKAAEAIETIHEGALDDFVPALAHHWAKASAPVSDTARAVEYAGRAGDRALAQLAHDEAVAYYRQALELLEAAGGTADDGRRLGLLLSLGEAERRAGDPAHRQTLLDAARMAQARGDADALARAALANNRGFFSVTGEVDGERVAMLEAAIDLIGPADSSLRARLLGGLAAELGFAPAHEHRERLSTEALHMARRLDDPATLGDVLVRRWTALAPTDVRQRHEELVELARVADQLADPTLAFWAAFWGCLAALLMGDHRDFGGRLDPADRLAGDLGQPFYRWCVGFMRSTQSRIAGRLGDAERQAQATLELGRAGGIPDSFQIYGTNLLWVRYDQGRLDDVVDLLRRAAQRDKTRALTKVALALTLCETGQRDEARAVFDDVAFGNFAIVPGNFTWLYGMTMAAEACANLGDVDRAAVLHDLLTPHCGLVGHAQGPGATGFIDHYVGLLATTLERFDEADARFADATRLNEDFGAPTWLARTRLEWARMLLTRHQPGDAERARELLGQALATARELGLAKVERDAVALLH